VVATLTEGQPARQAAFTLEAGLMTFKVAS
jgi:hypothetical protein